MSLRLQKMSQEDSRMRREIDSIGQEVDWTGNQKKMFKFFSCGKKLFDFENKKKCWLIPC